MACHGCGAVLLYWQIKSSGNTFRNSVLLSYHTKQLNTESPTAYEKNSIFRRLPQSELWCQRTSWQVVVAVNTTWLWRFFYVRWRKKLIYGYNTNESKKREEDDPISRGGMETDPDSNGYWWLSVCVTIYTRYNIERKTDCETRCQDNRSCTPQADQWCHNTDSKDWSEL